MDGSIDPDVKRTDGALHADRGRALVFCCSMTMRLALALAAGILLLLAATGQQYNRLLPAAVLLVAGLLVADSLVVLRLAAAAANRPWRAARLGLLVLPCLAAALLGTHVIWSLAGTVAAVAGEFALGLGAPRLRGRTESRHGIPQKARDVSRAEIPHSSPSGEAASVGNPSWASYAIDDSRIVQMVQRRVDSLGEQSIVGYFRFVMQAGKQLEVIHVPFCPALNGLPEVFLSQIEGPEVSMKASQVERFGIRIEARRSDARTQSLPIVLELVATERASHVSDAANHQKSVA